MTSQLFFRQVFVFITALIYWGGVLILAFRIRRHTGKLPNLKPGSLKERLLWLAWLFVIAGWIGQPLIIGKFSGSLLFYFSDHFNGLIVIFSGILLALSGYAGTLWCYSAIGGSWRMGINRNEKTELIKTGPYKFIRHPIYSFQVIIILGMAFLLPTPLSLIILIVNYVSILIKAVDEEAYLLNTHGVEYKEYFSGTGRFLPRFIRPKDN